MADLAMGMMKDSINAFVKNDAILAREICMRDDLVDDLRDQIIRELITYMMQDPTTIERVLQIMRIARSLERVADLSTNFSEDVVFMSEGKVIKHYHEE